uniref:Uncharacterized protein n=2 Tax=viral metagenome TaxID=1070528 RepID=A0A6M3K7X0_9ZZZZ
MGAVDRSGSAIVQPSNAYSLADLQMGAYRVNNGTVTLGVSPTDRIGAYVGTITVATGKSAGTLASVVSGIIRNITQTTPNLTGTGTATTELLDAAGGTIVSLAAQDESVVTNYGTIQPIGTTMSWVSTTSGTGQASAMNIILNVHYET